MTSNALLRRSRLAPAMMIPAAVIVLAGACSRTETGDYGQARPIGPGDGTPALHVDAAAAGTAGASADAGAGGAGAGGGAVGGGDSGSGAAAGSSNNGGSGGGDAGEGGTAGAGSGGQGGSGGTGGPCTADADCIDLAFCTPGACVEGACAATDRDADGDGSSPTECGGTDCNDLNPLAHVGGLEVCADGADNDCNGVADCRDPLCAGIPNCECDVTQQSEICDNGLDDDCDGALDCADPDCFNAPACASCEAEICDNEADDDCNGLIDCADDACRFQPGCSPTAEECNDGFDNDRDGKIDCLDTECSQNPYCLNQQSNCLTARRISVSGTYVGETFGNLPQTSGTCGGDSGEAVFALTLQEPSGVSFDTIGSDFDTTLYVREGSCTWGREIACDDDTGGQWTSLVTFTLLKPGTYFIFVDGFTVDPDWGPDEGNFVLNVDLDFQPVEDCTNGVDDDGDVYADCADPSCALFGTCATCNGGGPAAAEFGAAACTDGLDNDCDGEADCVDEDCSASDTMTTECCTGTDQNGNGIPDDFNCRCASDADCGNQICYSGTVQSCGIPCTWFVGDVCTFLAPGSSCNAATEECEF